MSVCPNCGYCPYCGQTKSPFKDHWNPAFPSVPPNYGSTLPFSDYQKLIDNSKKQSGKSFVTSKPQTYAAVDANLRPRFD